MLRLVQVRVRVRVRVRFTVRARAGLGLQNGVDDHDTYCRSQGQGLG